MGTLPSMLVSSDASRVICVGDDRVWTMDQLRGDAGRLARALSLASDAEVMVLCGSRYAFAVGLLACWSRGLRVRLPPDGAAETLASLADTVELVLCDDDAGAGLDVRPFLTGEPGGDAIPMPAEDRVLVMLSTSGSTGGVRSVPKTAGQLLGEAQMLGCHFGPIDGVVVATVPPRHIYGLLFSLLMPLLSNGAFADETPFFGGAVSAVVHKVGGQVLVTVPAHLRALTASPLDGLSGLTRVFSSGAPLPSVTAAALFAQHGLDATEVFGSTETGGVAWRHQRVAAVWTTLPGVAVLALPDGRLGVSSPFLPPAGPRPWVSDDRVTMVRPGCFEHLGRVDDVVKIASRRVSLGAVTRHILAVDGVEDAVVLAVASGERTRLKALLVAPDLDAQALRERLSGVLDGVAMPRLLWTDVLPRTSHGKLPRQAVLTAMSAAEKPSDGLERRRWRCTEDTAEALLVVRPDAPWFDGHFPDNPVLPGVAQLHVLIVQSIRRAWPDLVHVRGIPRVRFQAPVRPGARIAVRLNRQASRVRFVLEQGETCFASGALDMRDGESS